MSADDCLALMEKPEWFEDAACRGMDPDVFFPNVLETIEEDREIAKRVCANCSVRELCQDRGEDEEYGIWGGEDEDERWLRKGGPDSDMVNRTQQKGYWEHER